jgi:GNAT superfamily N-acetyltransferase
MSSPVIRHALPADMEAVTQTLIEAFTEDPFQRYMFPRADDPTKVRPAELARFVAAEVDTHVSLGHVYVANDGAAAALWEPPGVEADGDPLAQLVFSEVAAETLEADGEQWSSFVELRPDYPHFYLAILGASNRARGQGLGAALLERVLRVCDNEGLPAYLESSNLRNVSLYQRHGFDAVGELTFGTDTVLTPMVRMPRS